MAKKRNLSIEQRASVVTLSKEGYSGGAISARKLKISVCGVQAILRKALTTGMVKDRDRSGRSPSTTAREDRLLYRLSLSNRRSTSRIAEMGLGRCHRNSRIKKTLQLSMVEESCKFGVVWRLMEWEPLRW